MNLVLEVFHIGLILVNSLAWLWPKTRLLHAWAINLTAVSWLGVGAWVGNIGYCFLTDIQWGIKRELGEENLPHSYIVYIFDEFLGLQISRTMADMGAAIVFAFSLLYSWRYLYRRFWQKD